VVEPRHDEKIQTGETAVAYTRRVAQEKGIAVFGELQSLLPESSIIISADTTVYDNKRLLGKPGTEEEAAEMLSYLSGRSHYVVSAISMIIVRNHLRRRALAHKNVRVGFRPLSPSEIWDYIHLGEWRGKAGGYAVQGQGSRLVDYFQGSVTGIIGFPLRLYYKMLLSVDVSPLDLLG
jgi:septum formation protein